MKDLLITALITGLIVALTKKTFSGKFQGNDQVIYDTVIKAGYSPVLASLLIAQAKFESGNFTNNAFKKGFNAYGYKYYKGSPFQSGALVTSSEGDKYATYPDLKNSTLEVIYWLKRREKEWKLKISDLTTPLKYATALKKSGYYGGELAHYTKGLQTYLVG